MYPNSSLKNTYKPTIKKYAKSKLKFFTVLIQSH